MTKIIILTAVIGIVSNVQAQKVGVNVTNPAENLHVDSTIKVGKDLSLNASTVNRKNLVKFGDGNYVTIGEEITDDKLYIRYGDLVFIRSSGSLGSGNIGIGTELPSASLDIDGTLRIRSAAGAGKVLTSDANGNATWQTGGGGGGLTLPFAASDGSAGTSFIVANNNGAANAIAGQSFGSGNGIQGISSTGKGVYGSAGSGIGVDAFSSSGNAGVFTSSSGLAIKTVSGNVEINGKIKMIDGTQAAGRVLTSDASGLASWQNLPAGLPSIDIYCKTLTGAMTIPNNSSTRITGWVVENQAGGFNYGTATGLYTVPVAGFYQISGSILWDPIATDCTTFLSVVTGSGTVIGQNYQPSSKFFGVSCGVSCGRRFAVGETISFQAYQNSGGSVNLNAAYSGQNFSISYIHP